MATRHDLTGWVIEALRALKGHGSIPQVSREVCSAHEDELRASGDLFYTWQYEIRWAAQKLRNNGTLAPAPRGQNRGWSLAGQ